MATEATTDVQKAETANVVTAPEQTRTGPVYSPAVDIFENDNTITLLADMPGVKASDLEIDLRENVLTLSARVSTLGSAIADKDAPLLFLCRSGARSAAAAKAMTAAGYSTCLNVADGFEGPLDANGKRGSAAGWKATGLPWRQT